MKTEQLSDWDRSRVSQAKVVTSRVSTQGDRQFFITNCLTIEGAGQSFHVSVEIETLTDVFALANVCQECVILDKTRRFPTHLLLDISTTVPCHVIDA